MAGNLHERAFGALAAFSLRHPRLLLVITVAVILAMGALIPRLGVSTSRYGLVSENEPNQQRMIRFNERFGTPNTSVVLISGGTVDERRAAVDRLAERLGALPHLQGRVLARTGPADAAEVLLLQRPEALGELGRQLPPGIDILATLEGGLPAWFGAIAGQLEAGLEGEGAAVAPEDAAKGLRGLASVATAMDTYLTGGDPLASFSFAEEAGRSDLDERGYLITADRKHHVITLFPELPSDEIRDLRPFIESARAARDEAMKEAPAGVEALIAGMPAFAVDENDSLRRGLLVSSAASAIGILLLCFLLFRSLRQTILAMMPLFGGTVISLGIVRLLYSDLNLVTSSFVSVLLGLGIDFSVHVLTRINEERRRGSPLAKAVHDTVVHTGPGILSGAAVTAVAFLTTVFTDFTAYAELGVITAIGLAVIVAATLISFPPLLARTLRGDARVSPEAPGIAHVPGLLRRARVPVLVVAVAAAVGGAVALPTIGFRARFFDFLPQTSEFARGLGVLEFDPTMSPMTANLTAPDVEAARAMAQQLRSFPEVAGVQSASDLLPPLGDARLAALRQGLAAFPRLPDFAALEARRSAPDQLLPELARIIDALDEVRFALRGAGQSTEAVDEAHAAFTALKQRLAAADDAQRARLAAIEPTLGGLLRRAFTTAKAVADRGHYLPDDLPELLRGRFVAKDGKALALYAVPTGDIWDERVAVRFQGKMESVDPEVTGQAIYTHIHVNMIVTGFRRAAGLAAVLILVLLVIDFRGVRSALLALVPTALGWLWMLGAMALFGLDFNVANIVCLPLVLGIGTAFGVHLMHRCEESARERGGVADVDDLVRGTGSAVIISALTTMVGFAALMLGEYGAMITFGLMMVLGIGACLLASILALPALLLLLKRAR